MLNNQWNIWWEIERERNIKVGKFKPPLPAAFFNQETESSPIIGVTIPEFQDQTRINPGWVFCENSRK